MRHRTLLGVTLAAVLLIASTAVARRIDRASASGDFATVTASGSVDNPRTIRVRVTSSPRQHVTGNWNVVCSKGTGAGTKSGEFSGRTPLTRRMRLPMRHPDSCTAAALGSLDNGGRITVAILSP